MTDFILNLQKREGLGKNKVDKVRAEGMVPGVIYAKGGENVHVVAKQNELMKVIEQAGTSTLVDAVVDGETTKILFKEVQMHPYKNQILHFDLYGVNLKEKLKVMVSVVLENRDNIRVQPSVLMQLIDEVEVECLPTNLPSEALVDVQDMQIGQNILVSDLDVAKMDGITVITDLEEVVATLSEPREEVVEEAGEGVDAADVPTVEETEATEE